MRRLAKKQLSTISSTRYEKLHTTTNMITRTYLIQAQLKTIFLIPSILANSGTVPPLRVLCI